MPDELARRMEAARPHLEPRWDGARAEVSLRRLEGRLRRRRRARLAVVMTAAAGALAVVALGLGLWLGDESPRTIASTSGSPELFRPATTIHFVDGSTATALSAESELVATEVTETDVRVRLQRGRARFSVTPRPERLFQVEAGDVSVLVLGTVFSVSRQGDQVEVAVERGLVRVAWPGGARAISTGEQGLFPPRDEVEVPEAGPAAEDRAAPSSQRPGEARPRPVRPEVPGARWQALAERGQVSEAYEALHRAGGVQAPRGMDEALLAADVMRLSGHATEAAEVLRLAVVQHPGDPRASVASFTLGRVLLNQVGRPRPAAEAFARARRLSPGGALAEDALAREVEAWSRAGAEALARQRAQEYVDRYPSGRRLRAVRRFGGLE